MKPEMTKVYPKPAKIVRFMPKLAKLPKVKGMINNLIKPHK